LALSESSLHSLISRRVETNLMQLKSKAIVVLARCNLVSHFRTHLLARVAELGGWMVGLMGCGEGGGVILAPAN